MEDQRKPPVLIVDPAPLFQPSQLIEMLAISQIFDAHIDAVCGTILIRHGSVSLLSS